jgi:biopolymer transport protein ExbB
MFEFFKAGGPFMVLLVTTSVVAVAFIIERGLALRWNKVIPRRIQECLDHCNTVEDAESLRRVSDGNPSPIGRLLVLAIEQQSATKAETEDVLQSQARHEVVQLERGLLVLEIIVGIAPLLGLVGTIHGLITLFGDMGQQGVTDNSAFARGIAIALNTTLMGLLIAIPSLVAWSYFVRKVETMTVEMERMCDEFLRRQFKRKKKVAA